MTTQLVPMDEVPLSGGNVATGVVRIGDTVRKPQTPATPATKALLDALTTAGLIGIPRFLGIDDQGRQTLSFVPGDTAFPLDIWTNNQTLTSAARLLRRIHDASRAVVQQDLPWAYRSPDPSQHDVIGHSDFAPYNMTFGSDGAVTGVFDFDLAGPAPRLRDLAYLAWWMVPLGQQDPAMAKATQADIGNESHRLKHICQVYGVVADVALLDMVDRVLDHMSDPIAAAPMIGETATQTLINGGHLDHWARERQLFEDIKPKIAANLGL